MPNKLIYTNAHYVRQGGPPDDWYEFVVVDQNTNELVHQVLEVNTKEGWLIQMDPKMPEDRVIDTWPQIRREGNFTIMRMAEIDVTETVEAEAEAEAKVDKSGL
jgi:hypothetical protein